MNEHRSDINDVFQRLEEDENDIRKTSVNGRTVEEREGSIYVIEFESETDEIDERSTNSTTAGTCISSIINSLCASRPLASRVARN